LLCLALVAAACGLPVQVKEEVDGQAEELNGLIQNIQDGVNKIIQLTPNIAKLGQEKLEELEREFEAMVQEVLKVHQGEEKLEDLLSNVKNAIYNDDGISERSLEFWANKVKRIIAELFSVFDICNEAAKKCLTHVNKIKDILAEKEAKSDDDQKDSEQEDGEKVSRRDLVEKVQGFLGGLASDLVEKAKKIKTVLGDSSIAKELEEGIEKIIDLAPNMMKLGEEKLAELKVEFDALMQEFLKVYTGEEEIGNLFDDLTNAIQKENGLSKRSVVDSWASKIKRIIAELFSVFDICNEAAKKCLTHVNKIKDILAEKEANSEDETTPVAEEKQETTRDLEDVQNFLSGLAIELKGRIEMVKSIIGETAAAKEIENVFSEVIELAPTIASLGVDKFEEIKGEFEAMVQEFVKVYEGEEKLEDLFENIKEIFHNDKQISERSLGSIASKVKRIIVELFSIFNIVNDAAEKCLHHAKNIKHILSEKENKTEEDESTLFRRGAMDKVKDFFKDLGKKIEKSNGKIRDFFKKLGKDIDKSNEKIEQFFNSLGKKIAKGSKKISGFFTKLGEDLAQEAKKIKGIFVKNNDKIKAFFHNLGEDVAKKAEEVKGVLGDTQIANDLEAGLKQVLKLAPKIKELSAEKQAAALQEFELMFEEFRKVYKGSENIQELYENVEKALHHDKELSQRSVDFWADKIKRIFTELFSIFDVVNDAAKKCLVHIGNIKSIIAEKDPNAEETTTPLPEADVKDTAVPAAEMSLREEPSPMFVVDVLGDLARDLVATGKNVIAVKKAILGDLMNMLG